MCSEISWSGKRRFVFFSKIALETWRSEATRSLGRPRFLGANPLPPGEDLRISFGHQHGVLEMTGRFAVRGDDGPFIRQGPDGGAAEINHRFDRERHAGLELRPFATAPVVGNLRFLVQRASHAV